MHNRHLTGVIWASILTLLVTVPSLASGPTASPWQGGLGGGVPCAVPSPECPDAVAASPVAGGWSRWLVGRYRFNVEAPGFWTSEQDREADGLRGHSYVYRNGNQYFSVNAIVVDPVAGKQGTLERAVNSARASFERQFAQPGGGTGATFAHDRDGKVGAVGFAQYRVSVTTANGNFRAALRFIASDRFVYVLTRLNGDDADADGKRFFDSFELRKP